MIVIVLATLLVLGIAFNKVVQGLFSSLIMTILTVLCAAVAFGYYEVAAAAWLYSRQPTTADAVCLVALFVLPLLGLRLLLDKLISGNVVMSTWIDRSVGGVLGLVTGMTAVGVLLVAMQMLPFGPAVLGYRPFDTAMERDQRVWPFYPDEFVVGLAKTLSAGGLSGQRPFGHVHDDLLLEAFCARNDAGKNGRTDAQDGDLKVLDVFEPNDPDKPKWMDDVPANPRLSEPGLGKIVVVRVSVSRNAREGAAADKAARWWVLPATQFRLACSSRGPETHNYYPVACLTYVETPLPKEPEDMHWKCIVPGKEDGKLQFATFTVERPPEGRKMKKKKGEKRKDAKGLIVDWVYRIAESDTPEYVAFRRMAVPIEAIRQEADATAALQSPQFAAGALDRKLPSRRKRGW